MSSINQKLLIYSLVLFIVLLPRAICEQKEYTILFLGDSLTAGYGIETEQSYPSLIDKKLKDSGVTAKIINAGISGNTTAGGLRRLKWYFREHIDILVIALGSNDGLRGLDPTASKTNIQKMIDMTKKKFPDIEIIIAGMQIPPNMGEEYAESFRAIFPKIANENNFPLIPFLLEGVGGEKKMNLPDGIHPNPEGHILLCKNVWKILEPLVK